jgi:hypothetical protein
LPVRIVGYADATGLRYTFEPRSNIHAIAEYVVVFNHDVANVNADPDFNALFLRNRCVAFHHAILNLDRAACSIDRACKFNQNAIPSPLNDATAMRYDGRFQEFAPVSIKPRQGTFFISSHQAAVARNIACQDGG